MGVHQDKKPLWEAILYLEGAKMRGGGAGKPRRRGGGGGFGLCGLQKEDGKNRERKRL